MEPSEKDKKEARKLTKFSFDMLTKALLWFVGIIAGMSLFAWGCMNHDWRAVLAGVILQMIIGRSTKRDGFLMLSQRVEFIEERLRINAADAAIADVLKDE